MIPNPFEALGAGLTITISGVPVLFPPFLLNLLAEPIMYMITYVVVGMYYDRGSEPALGSILYLLFYCVHTFVLWLMSLADFSILAVGSLIFVYIGGHIFINRLRYSIFA